MTTRESVTDFKTLGVVAGGADRHRCPGQCASDALFSRHAQFDACHVRFHGTGADDVAHGSVHHRHGNIDLSVASTMAMCASLLGLLHDERHQHLGRSRCCACVGPRWFTQWVSGGQSQIRLTGCDVGYLCFLSRYGVCLSRRSGSTGYPEAFTYLGRARWAVSAFRFSAVLIYLLRHYIHADSTQDEIPAEPCNVIGNNEDAGYFAGVNVDRTKSSSS